MSFIGEAHGFSRSARELERRLRTETLSANERASLERQTQWLDEESRHAMADAARDGRLDADDARSAS